MTEGLDHEACRVDGHGLSSDNAEYSSDGVHLVSGTCAVP